MNKFQKFANIMNITVKFSDAVELPWSFKKEHHNPQIAFEIMPQQLRTPELYDWLIDCGMNKDKIPYSWFKDGKFEAIFVEVVDDYAIDNDEIEKSARLWLEANVWDGEDRRGTQDFCSHTPDTLLELVTDMLGDIL